MGTSHDGTWDGNITFELAGRTHVPEPLVPAIRAGVQDYGLAVTDITGMHADNPIFRQLVNEAVKNQIAHEEAQIRAWLQAIINDPAGRKIIEEML